MNERYGCCLEIPEVPVWDIADREALTDVYYIGAQCVSLEGPVRHLLEAASTSIPSARIMRKKGDAADAAFRAITLADAANLRHTTVTMPRSRRQIPAGYALGAGLLTPAAGTSKDRLSAWPVSLPRD